ncbi:hypothetical protein ACJMK2_037893 [Sinanodonta woodiana]|uniref:Uncharacterized protein n=1 Tax=Sinanodonta woodiana TaxID=1069815 RepID=A0ABD3WLU2_SINWO
MVEITLRVQEPAIFPVADFGCSVSTIDGYGAALSLNFHVLPLLLDPLSFQSHQESSSCNADIQNAGNSTSSSKKSTVQISASSSLYDFSDDFVDSPFSQNIAKTFIKPIKTKPQQSNKKKVQEGKKKFAVIASQKQHKKKKQKISANVKTTEKVVKNAAVKRIKCSNRKVSTPIAQNCKAAAMKSSIKISQVLTSIENLKTPVGKGEQNKSVSFCFKSPQRQPLRRKGKQPCNIDTNVQILKACDRKGSKVGTPALKRKKDVHDENLRETRSAKKQRLVQDIILAQSYKFLDKSSEVNSDHCDSGVFVSPILTKLKAKGKNAPKLPLSKLEAKETSTPIVKVVTNKHSGKSSLPSPAPRVETSLFDYSSMEVEESMFSQEEAAIPSTSAEGVEVQPVPVFNLNSTSEDEVQPVNRSYKSYKRSQKKIRVGRYSISKVEAWADKVNSQFDEIDKYELSIEG